MVRFMVVVVRVGFMIVMGDDRVIYGRRSDSEV